MKIYLDVIFLINFFFDFLLLFTTKQLLKERTSLKRLLFSSFIGSLSIFFLFLNMNTFTLFIFKLIISVIMIFISFRKDIFLKAFIKFYIVSIFLGGAMYLLNQTFSYKQKGLVFFSNGLSINLIVMIIISPILIYSYIKEQKSKRREEDNCYIVDLYLNKKKYELKGYLDTGNTLKDPYKYRSVILMDFSKIKIINRKRIYVPYKTITEEGVISCMRVDKVVIDNKEYKNLLIGDIKNKFQLENADCILPNSIKEDLC